MITRIHTHSHIHTHNTIHKQRSNIIQKLPNKRKHIN